MTSVNFVAGRGHCKPWKGCKGQLQWRQVRLLRPATTRPLSPVCSFRTVWNRWNRQNPLEPFRMFFSHVYLSERCEGHVTELIAPISVLMWKSCLFPVSVVSSIWFLSYSVVFRWLLFFIIFLFLFIFYFYQLFYSKVTCLYWWAIYWIWFIRLRTDERSWRWKSGKKKPS